MGKHKYLCLPIYFKKGVIPMKLQILIPQYKETDDIIRPLLDSIKLQQGIDFSEIGVIIVNDGSDVKLSEELIKSYPYAIDYYTAPHRGVSATRNTCLDYATADYIMYCDADDMFINMCGMYMIFREIKIGFDTLTSRFVEEAHLFDGKYEFINREKDATFVHGKIHRREYLIENNIRWNPNLNIHEDSFFNVQCATFTTNSKYLNEPFYLWKWRDDSVCRKERKTYMLETTPNLIDSFDAIIVEFEKRELHKHAIQQVLHTIFNIYYSLNKPEWRKEENITYLANTELRMYKFLKKYLPLWNEADDKQKLLVANALREKNTKEGMLLEDISVKEWIKKILDCYKTVK